MTNTRRSVHAAIVVATLAAAHAALAQSLPVPDGRISIYAQAGRTRSDVGGAGYSYDDVACSLDLHSPEREAAGFEYRFDGRGATYGYGERTNRFSLNDGWLGFQTAGGVRVRVGQVWLNELGALGAVGGGVIEYRGKKRSKIGRLRLGLFGGLEPKGFEAGYVNGVRKAGAFVALEGDGARRHVLGFVTIRNSGLTERSVLTMSNFIGSGRSFSLYQVAEADLSGPAGNGSGGLTYLFAMARGQVHPMVELSATYHRGRSIDTRTITQDQLNGRPISAAALSGFLYESAGGRITISPIPSLRIHGGYSSDRSNRDDGRLSRITAGISLMNAFGSGIDLTASDSRYQRTGGSTDSWYVSAGRNLGPKVYLSVSYSTSFSVLRFTNGGVVIESRPEIRRLALDGVIHLGRSVSLIVGAEETRDEVSTDDRGTLGLTFRF